MIQELTSPDYWDNVWAGSDVPKPLDPNDRKANGYVRRQLDHYFRKTLAHTDLLSRNPPARLIELGCGGSTFLPYFGKEFGFSLAGLDYSEVGCAKSRAIHAASSIPAEIVLGDVFDPPAHLLGGFDLVCSFGVAEHFRPTEDAIAAFARFAAPGGYLLTLVPNMCGVLGALQKRINRPIFDLHTPLTPQTLAAAHAACGLDVVNSGPVGIVNLCILNFSGPGSVIPERIGLGAAFVLSKTIWALHKIGVPGGPNAVTSPYFGCLARKRADA